MHFGNWPYLALFLLIPLFHRWWKGRNRSARVTFPLSVPKEAASRDPSRLLLLVRYAGLGLLILALARPQTTFRQAERTVNGVDIVLLLDVSASMTIEDLGNRSRITIAKEMLENFVKGRENDRIGFVMFSGEPLTLVPPTLDYGLLLQAIRGVNLGVLKDGTAIGDGLAVAVSHLRESKAKSRVVILLTDGDNNLGQVDPATAGDLAAGYGIRVYTIAIGREGPVKMPITRKGIFGNSITTYQWFDNALNPELLQYIAKVSGGIFFRVTDEGTLQSVFKEIDGLERSEVKTTEKVRYDDAFQRPLEFGAFLLAVEQILGRVWWRIIP